LYVYLQVCDYFFVIFQQTHSMASPMNLVGGKANAGGASQSA
jgi:hypothetical protein